MGMAQARLGGTVRFSPPPAPSAGSACRAHGPRPRFRRRADPRPRARCQPWIRSGLRRAVLIVPRLPRPRVHPARRPAVRGCSHRDARPPLPGRGSAAIGPGPACADQPRATARLRARVRRAAPVRGGTEGTRRVPGTNGSLSVRAAGPPAAVRGAVCRRLRGPYGSGGDRSTPRLTESGRPRAAITAPSREEDRSSGPMPTLGPGQCSEADAPARDRADAPARRGGDASARDEADAAA